MGRQLNGIFAPHRRIIKLYRKIFNGMFTTHR
jgi:hypothetical protein